MNSRHILQNLRENLASYPGLALEREELEFRAPFAPLLHYWPEISQSMKETTDPEAFKHFEVFMNVVEPELELPMRKARECHEHGKIEFDYLWTLFKPGESFVYWKKDGTDNIGCLKDVSSMGGLVGDLFSLSVEQVDFNGMLFGYKERPHPINSFKGYRPISDFIMPLDMRADKEEIVSKLIQRGKKFESLRGYHFKALSGNATTEAYHASSAGPTPPKVLET